jgi:hypothetical protein
MGIEAIEEMQAKGTENLFNKIEVESFQNLGKR